MIDRKMGQVHIEGKPEDEPCFVLRAQDKFAVAAMQHYAEILTNYYQGEMVTEVDASIADFERWQAEHPEKVKTPD